MRGRTFSFKCADGKEELAIGACDMRGGRRRRKRRGEMPLAGFPCG
jgi:hypothetical protein